MERKKQKLIDVIRKNFSGSYTASLQLYKMDYTKLNNIKHELFSCEEFNNCNVVLIDRVNDMHLVNTITLTDEDVLKFDKGTFYLYQINTIDFKTFDIRGHFELAESHIFDFNVGELTGEYVYDLEGLTEYQHESISKLIEHTKISSNSLAPITPGYILHQIKDFKKENISQQYLNNLTNDIDSFDVIKNELDSIEKTLNACDSLDDEQVLMIKEKMKIFDSKLKDKVKPKTITISSSVHNKIKKYCQDFGLKIGDWVEETLLKAINIVAIEKVNLSHEEYIVEESKKLIERYKEYKKTNKLMKLDKLVFNKKFKFIGYSQIDFKPVYDYLGTEEEFVEDSNNIRCNFTLVQRDIYVSKYLPEFSNTQIEGYEDNWKELYKEEIETLKHN